CHYLALSYHCPAIVPLPSRHCLALSCHFPAIVLSLSCHCLVTVLLCPVTVLPCPVTVLPCPATALPCPVTVLPCPAAVLPCPVTVLPLSCHCLVTVLLCPVAVLPYFRLHLCGSLIRSSLPLSRFLPSINNLKRLVVIRATVPALTDPGPASYQDPKAFPKPSLLRNVLAGLMTDL
uniref:Uncharacterized protein n=1 Tax=Cyprinodon variegatus TaxID=28743 RepID=A0A3Q2CU49_CYPVA